MSPKIATFVEICQQQRGEPYVFGAEVNEDGSLKGTQRWDCSELTSVAAHKAGGYLPDGSIAQRDYCKAHGKALPVQYAISTYGALLFIHERGHHHVAVSLGNGQTIEARGRAYGVGNFSAYGRGWTSGGLVPGFDYGNEEEDWLEMATKAEVEQALTNALKKDIVDLTADGGGRYSLVELATQAWRGLFRGKDGKTVQHLNVIEEKLNEIITRLDQLDGGG